MSHAGEPEQLSFTRKFLTAWESGGRRMISNPTDDEKYMIFRALVRMIKTNSGDGFLNSDQSHPAYLLGAQGKVDAVMGGDSPEKTRFSSCLSRSIRRITASMRTRTYRHGRSSALSRLMRTTASTILAVCEPCSVTAAIWFPSVKSSPIWTDRSRRSATPRPRKAAEADGWFEGMRRRVC